MEEIEYKLKQNNAILIVQAVSKLVEIIKLKKSKSENNEKKCSDITIIELQLLKSKCGVEDPIVSTTASHGVVSLVEDGVLPIGATLSDLMVILSTAKCHTGITNAIGNLLLLDLRRSLEFNKTYKCPFQIQKPQHPLITVLFQNQDIWLEIFNQIQLFINHYDNKIAINSLELLRPVFFYILCDPSTKLKDTARRQVWNLLTMKDDILQVKLLTFEILSWMQINSRQKCLELRDFLMEACNFAIKSRNTEMSTSIILYLTSLTHRLVKYGCDPTPNISTIIEMLKLSSNYETHSVVLAILSETIPISPPMYLTEILRLFNDIHSTAISRGITFQNLTNCTSNILENKQSKIIIVKQSANVLAVKAIVSSVLQWLFYPSVLLSDALKLANEIVLFTETHQSHTAITGNLYRDIYFKYIQFADSNIDLALKLCLLAERWQTDERYLLNWLEQALDTPFTFLSKIFNFICAIFIHQFKDLLVTQKALDILLKLVKNKPELSFNVLVLILHKLTEEKDPNNQVALLKAIPLMAVSKHNIPLIVNTLETVKNGQITLKTLLFEIFLQLWSTEVRCFPYLQKILMENEDNWEFGIAKAHTLKEICIRRPNLHGKDMVVHLSQILNKYSDSRGSIASSLAIEGITILCENGIVDIVSTWNSISPRLMKDKRTAVIVSLCDLLSKFANLQSNTTEFDATTNEVICKLWNYVASSEYVQIIEAALKALSKFDVEKLTLKQLPDVFRQKLKLPSTYAKTPVDAARKPEDVLPYIPGECWIQLLQNINHDALKAAGNLLIHWVRTEIAGYKSGIYMIPEGKTEPLSYDYLPDKSIVRALGNYIRLVGITGSKYYFSEQTVTQSLRVLSEPYSKPLPPLDWHFLLDLFSRRGEIRRLCINLTCKQVLISGSARKIMENLINDFKPDVEKSYEMKVLFGNLGYLCEGIPPNTLRPMITNSLCLSYQKSLRNDPIILNGEDLFKTLVEHLKAALLVEDIHEANRTLLGQIIESFSEQLFANNATFDVFLTCIVETSTKYIDRISSPSLWWETTEQKFEKAIKVRCALALKSKNKPFIFLNECINTAATLPSVQIYTLRNILNVFRFHNKHSSVSDWILELMGQIQEKLTNKDKNADEITFLCDVFLVAVIVFSGHNFLYPQADTVAITKEARLNLFPSAIFSFVSERYPHVALEVMEWLYHMTETLEVPDIYQMTFYQSLTTLRHEKAFCDSSKWMKYVSVKRPIC